jgi:hypothetical protein
VSADQSVEILDRRDRELDAGHPLELVERGRLAGERLRAAELRAL